MNSTLLCAGCSRPIPAHHIPFMQNPAYNLWVREGYCSYFCFVEKAPAELLAKDEEIEKKRQEAISGLSSRPD